MNTTLYLCQVCYWEDDKIQNNNPDYDGGANEISLNEAKVNFIKMGAIKEEFIRDVRDPLDDEVP